MWLFRSVKIKCFKSRGAGNKMRPDKVIGEALDKVRGAFNKGKMPAPVFDRGEV